jgi:antirestriction protein ArdC
MSTSKVYDIVTERILEALNQGIVPWDRPWVGTDAPRNGHSGKYYRGINILLLGLAAMVKNYTDNIWLTYKQCEQLGGQVRKGERSVQVVFWNIGKREVEVAGELEERKSFMLRYYNVFNVAQCEGVKLPPRADSSALSFEHSPIEEAQAVWENWDGDKPTLKHGGASAYYMEAKDLIAMPKLEKFKTAEDYYHTLFHEMIHATGAKKRLDRGLNGNMRTESYAKEELVAEMGAAFLTAIVGLDVNPARERNTVAYIQGWKAKIAEDNKLVLTAASAAQKAIDLITNRAEAN